MRVFGHVAGGGGVYLFAGEGLDWWLGREFAVNGELVAQVLLLGVFVNALGQVAITVLHGAGRADWAAKLHLIELPFYLVALMYAAKNFGIDGVAWVWMIRVSVDTAVMVILAERVLMARLKGGFVVMLSAATAVLILWLAGGLESVVARGGVFFMVFLACVMVLPGHLGKLVRASRNVD